MKNADHKGIGRRKNKNTPFKKRTAPEMGWGGNQESIIMKDNKKMEYNKKFKKEEMTDSRKWLSGVKN